MATETEQTLRQILHDICNEVTGLYLGLQQPHLTCLPIEDQRQLMLDSLYLMGSMCDPRSASDAMTSLHDCVSQMAKTRPGLRIRKKALDDVDLPLSRKDLVRLLGNLIKNAQEANPSSAMVSIDWQNFYDGWVEVYVHNFAPERPDFSHLNAGISTKGPHRGHGLASVGSILKDVGGTLTFDWFNGITEARVRIPYNRGASKAVPPGMTDAVPQCIGPWGPG